MQLVTDVNLAVSVEAIQAIGNLAKGLRSHFGSNSRFILPVLLVRTPFLEISLEMNVWVPLISTITRVIHSKFTGKIKRKKTNID